MRFPPSVVFNDSVYLFYMLVDIRPKLDITHLAH